MKKTLSFLVLVSLFVPLFSNALIMLPTANITVIVKTDNKEGNFNFNVSNGWEDCSYDEETDEETCWMEWYSIKDFSLQTENYVAENSFLVDSWNEYKISQEPVDGFEISDISCESDVPLGLFGSSYEPNSVIITPPAYANIVCTFTEKSISNKTPVLIVPGIMGTELEKDGELLWADVSRMFTSITDNFMDPLAFNNNLTPSDGVVNTTDVIKLKSFFDYTQGLIEEFQNQGYVENQDLFLFPYDWRYGVSGKYGNGKTNSDLLKEKIAEILAQTGAEKIDVIAHSNGGLVVKKYVMENADNHKINKAIFVGVPNTGSVKSVKALVVGDNMGVSFANLGLSESEMKKISQNLPVSYDLLPSQEYYKDAGSFVSLITGKVGNTTKNDLDYAEFETYLSDKNFNSTAITNSENLHTENFDNYDLRTAGIDLYNIAGCKSATLTNFVESQVTDSLGNKNVAYGNVELKTGDGTVPVISAVNLPVDSVKQYYVLKTDHSNLLSSDGSRQEIVNLISGSNLSVSNKVTQDYEKCTLNGKIISIFSPVDISVADQNGNQLKLADDRSITNQILGSDFEIWDDHKFVFLPTDENQNYTISLQGTDTGTATIKTQQVSGDTAGNTEVFSNILVTNQLTGQINLDNSKQTTITLKEAPDSVPVEILPSIILDDSQQDLIAPISVIKIDKNEKNDKNDFWKIGKFWNKKWENKVYKDKVQVEILAKDYVVKNIKKFLKKNKDNNSSGVLEIMYNLDNTGWQKVLGDKAEFVVDKDGEHTILFFATDKAGNNELEREFKFEIKNAKHNKKN
jgi:triacylglycerol esterase/lipase EstA (alpha/beta hydrolase family)